MNNIVKYLLIAISIVSFSSCLDKEPISEISEDSFFKNEMEVDAGLLACYNGLMAPLKYEWYLTELRSDNSRHSSATSSSNTVTEMYMLDNNSVHASLSVIKAYWDAVYFNIENCNKVLANLSVVSNDSIRKEFEGEAKFIRSYHYFNLVRLFGPVFIVKESLNAKDAYRVHRSVEEEVYKMLEEDLNDACNKLPAKYPNNKKGRVTLAAAQALLAKIYITQDKYNQAKPLLQSVMSNPDYGLVSSYADVFSIDKELNQEMIFVARFKTGNMKLGNSFANDFAPSGSSIITGNGRGFNAPTVTVINTFEPNDVRKDISLKVNWVDNSGGIKYVPWNSKFFSQPQVKDDAENDFPIIRFAEVVLLLAEVYNQEGNLVEALNMINKIRDRAKIGKLTTAQIASKAMFSLALEKERQLEFLFENQRFFDLVRTGRLITVMKKHYEEEQFQDPGSGVYSYLYTDPSKPLIYRKSSLIESWQILLPLPSTIIDVAPLATQNVGY